MGNGADVAMMSISAGEALDRREIAGKNVESRNIVEGIEECFDVRFREKKCVLSGCSRQMLQGRHIVFRQGESRVWSLVMMGGQAYNAQKRWGPFSEVEWQRMH